MALRIDNLYFPLMNTHVGGLGRLNPSVAAHFMPMVAEGEVMKGRFGRAISRSAAGTCSTSIGMSMMWSRWIWWGFRRCGVFVGNECVINENAKNRIRMRKSNSRDGS